MAIEATLRLQCAAAGVTYIEPGEPSYQAELQTDRGRKEKAHKKRRNALRKAIVRAAAAAPDIEEPIEHAAANAVAIAEVAAAAAAANAVAIAEVAAAAAAANARRNR